MAGIQIHHGRHHRRTGRVAAFELAITPIHPPGDECAIYLGGQLAVSGVITSRQTAYDAENKGVQLAGKGITWYAARASIKGNRNFDNKNFMQIAEEVLGPFRVGFCTIGTINPEPFEKLQAETGESIWVFLERIARVRGIVIGSDHRGAFVFIDNHLGQVAATLIEGVNILRMQATISIDNIFSEYIVSGQTPGGNMMNMTNAAEQEQSASGTAKRFSPLVTPAEQPVWSEAELAERAAYEAIWHEGYIIQVTVTLQGWFMPNGRQLWAPGLDVIVLSPMAMIVADANGQIGMTLKIQTVTFTQDAGGSLTTLDLVPPWQMKDQIWNFTPLGGGAYGNGPPKGTPPAAPPPAQAPPDPPPDTLGPNLG